MKPLPSLVILLLLSLCACASQPLAPGLVRTTQGLAQGVAEPGDTTAFRGIEYARAERWQLPVDAPAWEGTRRFDAFGPACPQAGQSEMLEDCLFLNVFTPNDAAVGAARPVLVWIHGGGFRAGRGAADPMGFARQGVVVVTFNYRLGALGFHDWPGWDESMPRNFGQADMVKALQWVQQNIAAFGGDPAQVTLAGHSAGGMGVQLMMADPRARGLFARAIADAGYASWTLPRALNPSDELRQRIRYGALETTLPAAEWVRRMPGFHLPIVGGSDLPRPPIDVFRSGEQAPVPYLSGANSFDGEGILQAAGWTPTNFIADYRDDPRLRREYAADFRRSEDQAAARLFGDMRYVFAAWASVRAMDQVDQPGWLFYFDRADPGLPGAAHGSHYRDLTEPASAALMAYYLGFVRTGAPQANALPTWPAYRADRPLWMLFDPDARPTEAALEARMQVLQQLPWPPAQPSQVE